MKRHKNRARRKDAPKLAPLVYVDTVTAGHERFEPWTGEPERVHVTRGGRGVVRQAIERRRGRP